jgi:hypothetical protein
MACGVHILSKADQLVLHLNAKFTKWNVPKGPLGHFTPVTAVGADVPITIFFSAGMLVNRIHACDIMCMCMCTHTHMHMCTCMRVCVHVSHPHSSSTPGVFYAHFYNHAHRLRLEKLLCLELSRSPNGLLKALLDPGGGFRSEMAVTKPFQN